MYRQSAASMKRKAVTPACKHCENLKLPSSHWLRSLAGAIVCPVLLATECRYCHLAGHTVKACPELALKNKTEPQKVVRRVLDTNSEEKMCRESTWNGKPSFAKVVSKPPAENLSLIHPEKLASFEFTPFPKSPESSPPLAITRECHGRIGTTPTTKSF